MHTENKTQLKNWLISLAVNAVILVDVLLCTHMMYETNDDFGIAAKLANGYPFIGFINYYLCKILVAIQSVLPNINVFVLSQLVLSFIAFVVAYKVIIDRSKSVAVDIMAAAILLFYSLDHYCAIQFTKTAGLLLAAGLLLVVDEYFHERRISGFIIGFLLFYLGVAFRQKGMLPALAFAGVFIVVWLLLDRFASFKKRGIVRELIIALILIAIAIVPYGLDVWSDAMNASTSEMAYARAYQKERTKITDYPVYENYEANKASYDAIGLSENDIYLVSHWMLDYNGAASIDNLKKINEISAPSIAAGRSVAKAAKKFARNVIKDVLNLKFKGIHIIILSMISLLIVLLTKPRNWLYIAAIAGLTICIYVAVYYMQRPQYRAFYVADISATLWLLYVLAMNMTPSRKKTALIGSLACAIAVAGMFISMLPKMENQFIGLQSKIESDAFVQFYQDNNDKFYVCSTSSKKRHPSYLEPIQVPVVEKNATGMGGWGTLAPYELNQLSEYGLDNLVGDIINNENVYYVGTTNRDRMLEYYNKWYGDSQSQIVFSKAAEIEGTEFFRVVRITR